MFEKMVFDPSLEYSYVFIYRIEWLYFCVFKFSRNAKDFTPFFAKFRENCESNKTLYLAENVPYGKSFIFTKIVAGNYT